MYSLSHIILFRDLLLSTINLKQQVCYQIHLTIFPLREYSALLLYWRVSSASCVLVNHSTEVWKGTSRYHLALLPGMKNIPKSFQWNKRENGPVTDMKTWLMKSSKYLQGQIRINDGNRLRPCCGFPRPMFLH